MSIIEKKIHPVSDNDLRFYKKLCPHNSFYFSNSRAYLNSYIVAKKLFCYNDQESIFFFGQFSEKTLFLCCPKGKYIKDKIVQFLLFAKRQYEFNRIWLFEVSANFNHSDFKKIDMKEIQKIEMKRDVLILERFKDLPAFLETNRKLRRKWNHFFNILNKKEDRNEIAVKKLTSKNLSEAKKIITTWYEKIKDKKTGSFLPPEIILDKNILFIKNAILNPKYYECYIFYCNDRARGVEAAFKIDNSSSIAASILCTDRSIAQTATVLDLLFFQLMANKGYESINLGNSYSRSIEKYKSQFKADKFDIAYEYHLSF